MSQSLCPIYALLDNVRSLHNVGAIFRTADGVNLKKIYLCGITGTPPRKEITKTAIGAEDTVSWEYKKSALKTVKFLKKKYNTQIVVLEKTEESENYVEAEIQFPIVLVVGHEIDGVDKRIIKIADKIIHLPMLGTKESLNVATAFGIGVYEMLRKFKIQSSKVRKVIKGKIRCLEK